MFITAARQLQCCVTGRCLMNSPRSTSRFIWGKPLRPRSLPSTPAIRRRLSLTTQRSSTSAPTRRTGRHCSHLTVFHKYRRRKYRVFTDIEGLIHGPWRVYCGTNNEEDASHFNEVDEVILPAFIVHVRIFEQLGAIGRHR